MATSIGSAVAEPLWDYDGCEIELEDIGVLHELADGNLQYDYIGTRYAATLHWHGLTSAEKGTIRTQYLVKTAQSFTGPDGTTFTAFVVPNSWKESYIEDGDATARYKCELKLRASAVIA